jgi:hypothetical protein
VRTGNAHIDAGVAAGRVTLAVGPAARIGGRTGAKGESEAGFQRRVIALAQANGWKVAHFRKARTKTGWVTPVAADGKGFPDLVLIRGPVVLAAELKADAGRPTPEQTAWLAAFRSAGIAASVWRPRDWNLITAALGVQLRAGEEGSNGG